MAPCTRGLHELQDRCYAYLQPDGGWGWSNAGLVVGDGASLLIDTLFDLRMTAAMLEAMAPVREAAPIATVVNTHANGDHCYGNQLVSGAEIVARCTAGRRSTSARRHRLRTLEQPGPLRRAPRCRGAVPQPTSLSASRAARRARPGSRLSCSGRPDAAAS